MVALTRCKLFIMVDQFMRKTAIIKAAIAVPRIGIYGAARFYMLFNQSLKSGALYIRDGNCSNRSVTLDQPNYGSFASSASASFPFSFPAKVCFIDLNMAAKLVGKRIALNGLSYLHKHLPGGLVGHPDFIFQLVRRNPYLKESDGAYPFGNRRPGLFKDSTSSLRKLILAASALVFKAVFLAEPPDNLMATCRASYSLWPTYLVKKLATLSFISKIKSIIVQPHGDLLHLEFAYPSIQLVPLRG
jgi:hypothetical protein